MSNEDKQSDDILEKRIAAAARSLNAELDLSGRKLPALPESIGKLTGLQTLPFSNTVAALKTKKVLSNRNGHDSFLSSNNGPINVRL
jgi:hypothetical protein